MQPIALIIDGNPSQGLSMRASLEMAAYNAELVTDISDAVHRLQFITPRLLVINLETVDKYGEQLISMMRQDLRFSNTHLVVTSENQLSGQKLQNQADFILYSPIDYQVVEQIGARLRIEC